MQNLGFAVSQQKRQVVYGIPANFKGNLANSSKEKQIVVPDKSVSNESQAILESVNLKQSDLQEEEEIIQLENNPITFAKNINKRHKKFKKRKDSFVSGATCTSCG